MQEQTQESAGIINLPVKQLNVREAADVMEEIQGGWRIHAIDIVMDGKSYIPSPMIFAVTDTDYESFPLELTPDQVEELYEKVEKANPFLSGSVRRKMESAMQMLQGVRAQAFQRIIEHNLAALPENTQAPKSSDEQPSN